MRMPRLSVCDPPGTVSDMPPILACPDRSDGAAGREDPARVERALDRALRLDRRLVELPRQLVVLDGSDAVLARDRAAELEREARDVVDHDLRCAVLFGVSPASTVGCRLPSPACATVLIARPCRRASASRPANIRGSAATGTPTSHET